MAKKKIIKTAKPKKLQLKKAQKTLELKQLEKK